MIPDSEEGNESTTFLSIGGGRLTLDMNNDGQISGDSEIIGASTGNGFAELTVHDEDGNGWIDENDSVYGQLGVSYKDAEGNEVVSGLKESNVGAINLGSVDTPFALKDSDNQQVGQIEIPGRIDHLQILDLPGLIRLDLAARQREGIEAGRMPQGQG